MTKTLRAIALASVLAGAAALGGCATCNEDDPPPPPATNSETATTSASAFDTPIDPKDLLRHVQSSKRMQYLLPRDGDAAAADTGD